MLKRIVKWGLVTILVLGLGFYVFVTASYDKNYNEDYAVPDLQVTLDSALIERGRYLAYGPAHCAHCHAPISEMERVEAGEEVALTGGFNMEIPPGTFSAPNITPDPETGIGNLSDGELYRMLRYNVNHRGQACVDFMPFVNMAEDDIHALIAFLRSQEPVKAESKTTELSFLGKMVYALGAIKPGVPDEDVPEKVEPKVNKEYGRYLAYAVANCRGCHTNRDMKTGKYIGEEYAGGLAFKDNLTAGYTFVSPNLTPDKETGIMAEWDEETFVNRMQAGRVHANSPMPWGSFAQTSEDDLRAIYRYLMSLEPIHNEVEATVIPPES